MIYRHSRTRSVLRKSPPKKPHIYYDGNWWRISLPSQNNPVSLLSNHWLLVSQYDYVRCGLEIVFSRARNILDGNLGY